MGKQSVHFSSILCFKKLTIVFLLFSVMIPAMISGHIYKFIDSETKSETEKGDNTKKENVL